jgi:hypothetical protein
VGRAAGLTCMPLTLGGRRSARPHPPAPGPVGAPPTPGKIPATILPRPRRRDASSLGPRPAHSRLASQPANIRVAVRRSTPLRRGPGQPQPGHHPARQHHRGTPGAAHRQLPLDGAVPYQKDKPLGHGFRNFANYRLRLLLHCGVRWQTQRTASLRGRAPRLVT